MSGDWTWLDFTAAIDALRHAGHDVQPNDTLRIERERGVERVYLNGTLCLGPPVERQHQWEFYMNGSFCKVCGVAIGSDTPCR